MLVRVLEAAGDLHPELGDPNLSPAYLDRLVPGYRDVLTYACGPAPMIDAVRAVYDGSDVLRVEYFQPQRTSGTSAEGDVAFVRSGVEVANTGATLLEQAERAGLTPEFGCRMGICLSCTPSAVEPKPLSSASAAPIAMTCATPLPWTKPSR